MSGTNMIICAGFGQNICASLSFKFNSSFIQLNRSFRDSNRLDAAHLILLGTGRDGVASCLRKLMDAIMPSCRNQGLKVVDCAGQS